MCPESYLMVTRFNRCQQPSPMQPLAHYPSAVGWERGLKE